MLSLQSNLIKRINRLPKPTNTSTAMIPLFEAISNAIQSTQDKFKNETTRLGRIIVTVNTGKDKDKVWASIEDNGHGLNDHNWNAFLTTDTDNKEHIGGKGVGRLLWLDCFSKIEISSVYEADGKFRRRKFDFVLAQDNQIQGYEDSPTPNEKHTSFFVKFSNMRRQQYKDKFPARGGYVFQHFISHFLPTLIGGKSPHITLSVGSETKEYPSAIAEIVKVKSSEIPIETLDFGLLNITLLSCDKVASADLQGLHFVHFIGHDRTVRSQNIDGKLGLKHYGDDALVFHAIVTGDYLNQNVNQERTAFLFEDAVIDRIINEHCYEHIAEFLAEPIARLRREQMQKIENITATYPSVAFGDAEELQKRVPSGELKDDAIYGHLARERFRRDERQAEKIRNVLARLKEGMADINTFGAAIADASKAMEDAEQRSLAEYIVRRKVILDFIEILLQKVRDDDRDSSYQREDILHSFICPVRAQTITGSGIKIEAASSHDLWIVDERLTFAQYFSSDVEFSTLAKEIESAERPDVLIFDHVHGLRQTDQPSKVLLVEFKRPGRAQYDDADNPQLQVERYVRRLQSGGLNDVRGRPIKLDQSTIFYCFIVADIVGRLDEWTFSWQRTADGKGRIYRPGNGFQGSIELIGWDDLLSDARARNQAFFDKAGISGKSFFSQY